MTKSLSFNVDAYGSRGRGGAIVDFMELWALGEKPQTIARAIAFLRDVGMLDDVERDLYGTYSADGDDQLRVPAEEVITELLEERADSLGDGYPFELDNDKLICTSAEPSAYLLLLAMTILHAYASGPEGRDIELSFEEAACNAMKTRTPLTLAVGTSAQGNFRTNHATLLAPLELEIHPGEITLPMFAKDLKADIVSHIPLGDLRLGMLVVFGQATCAQAPAWEDKIHLPLGTWEELLRMRTPAKSYLAVPHHIDRDYTDYLLRSYKTPIVDRLRLIAQFPDLTAEDIELVDHLKSLDFVSP